MGEEILTTGARADERAIDQPVAWSARGNPAQMALLECSVFEVFFGGARGGGKTDGMLGEWANHADRQSAFLDKAGRDLFICAKYLFFGATVAKAGRSPSNWLVCRRTNQVSVAIEPGRLHSFTSAVRPLPKLDEGLLAR